MIFMLTQDVFMNHEYRMLEKQHAIKLANYLKEVKRNRFVLQRLHSEYDKRSAYSLWQEGAKWTLRRPSQSCRWAKVEICMQGFSVSCYYMPTSPKLDLETCDSWVFSDNGETITAITLLNGYDWRGGQGVVRRSEYIADDGLPGCAGDIHFVAAKDARLGSDAFCDGIALILLARVGAMYQALEEGPWK